MFAWLALGCMHGTLPPREAPTQPVPAFVAGVAKVDLTPPPGYPMAGHAFAGEVARGHWLRLSARAFYFEQPDGEALALVVGEMWAAPAGIGERVAEKLAKQHGLRALDRDRIVVAGTHTHQGPGNAWSAPAYNEHAGPNGGFDRRMFEWITDRLARAIAQAHRDKRPALLSVTRGAPARGFSWNRSADAFVLNPEARSFLAARPGDLPLAQRAVDPGISILRVRAADDDALLGMAVFLGVHPTVLKAETPVYQSDALGAAALLSERRLRCPLSDEDASATSTTPSCADHGPVVAIFNGAEGDVSPLSEHRDSRDVIARGQQIADFVTRPDHDWRALTPAIEHRTRVVPMDNVEIDVYESDGSLQTFRTARHGLPGVAVFGGAEDGRTVFWDAGWREGVHAREPWLEGQGSKQPALDPVFATHPNRVRLTAFLTGGTFPRDARLALHRLADDLLLVSLPGEFSTILGERTRAAVARAAGLAPDEVLLLGLADDYFQYFTTPEEYFNQDYEGASMLYGPHSGLVVKRHLEDMAQGKAKLAARRRYRHRVGSRYRYGYGTLQGAMNRPDMGLKGILVDPVTGAPRRDFPRFCWDDVQVPLKKRHNDAPVTPTIRVEHEQGGAWTPLQVDGIDEGDDGPRVVSTVLEVYARRRDGRRMARWCAIWIPSPAPPAEIRFHVETLSGQAIESPPLRVNG